MAARYAVATGNWSNTATWDGGTLPGPGDTVRPNGFTVTINQDVTATLLTNGASSPAVAGGSFAMSGNRTITAALSSVTSGVPLLSLASQTAAIVGAVTGGVSGTSTSPVVSVGASTILTVTGNVTGGPNGSVGVTVPGTNSTVNVIGDVTAGAAAIGLNADGSWATINVTGNCAGASGVVGLSVSGNSSAVTVAGNISGGGAGSGGHGVSVTGSSSSSTVSVTGTVTGGSSTNTWGLLIGNSSCSSVLVTGNVTAGSATNAYGVYVGAAVAAAIHGDLRGATNGTPAVYGSSTNTVIDVVGDMKFVVGNTIGATLGTVGIWRFGGTIESGAAQGLNFNKMVVNSTYGVIIESRDDSLWPAGIGTTPKYVSSYPSGLPVPADVREGTTYGVGLSDTGTLAVPDPGAVAIGVPTDDTVGEAALTPAAVWAVGPGDMDPGTIGGRLANTSTVETTGAQLAAALDDPA